MRQPDWFKLRSAPMQTPWQHGASFFIGISTAGTFVALFVLIIDGWVDALAIYIICSLLLAILLSQSAAQHEQSNAKPAVEAAASKAGSRQLGLVSKRPSWLWSESPVQPQAANQPASPPTLSRISPTD